MWWWWTGGYCGLVKCLDIFFSICLEFRVRLRLGTCLLFLQVCVPEVVVLFSFCQLVNLAKCC